MKNQEPVNPSAALSDTEWTKRQLLRKLNARAELFPDIEAMIHQRQPYDTIMQRFNAPSGTGSTTNALEATSKLIALVLRHKPGSFPRRRRITSGMVPAKRR